MFRQLFQKMSAWVESADILGGDLSEHELEPLPPQHPHRRSLVVRPERRSGSVAARPAVCVAPVRSTSGARSQPATRP
jgi:hypothetical protein